MALVLPSRRETGRSNVSWIEAVREPDGRVYFDGAHFYEEGVLDLPLELASKEKIRTALTAETSTSRDEENRLLKQCLGSVTLTPKKGFERDPKTAVPVKVALPVKLWRGVVLHPCEGWVTWNGLRM